MLATSIWLPLIYQYSVGGAIFFVGLVVAIRRKAVRWGPIPLVGRRDDRFWIVITLLGLVAYFSVHLAGYLAALYILPAQVSCPMVPFQ